MTETTYKYDTWVNVKGKLVRYPAGSKVLAGSTKEEPKILKPNVEKLYTEEELYAMNKAQQNDIIDTFDLAYPLENGKYKSQLTEAERVEIILDKQ